MFLFSPPSSTGEAMTNLKQQSIKAKVKKILIYIKNKNKIARITFDYFPIPDLSSLFTFSFIFFKASGNNYEYFWS